MKNFERIEKVNKLQALNRSPTNLLNYDQFTSHFNWEDAKSALTGLPGNKGINIAYEAVDRHLKVGKGQHLAFRWIGKNNQIKDFSYKRLYELSNQMANALEELGVTKGESVFTLLGRIPELYITALGALKHRTVFSPLYSAFGPEPIKARLLKGEAKVLVTTKSLYLKKIAAIRRDLPLLTYVLLIEEIEEIEQEPILNTIDFNQLLMSSSPKYEIGPTNKEDPALLHFTSGTTGMPKGALHVHEAVLAHYWTGRLALDFHEDDIFWCTADPGWVTGTSYGIISPLVNGITSIIDEEEFNIERWYHILSEQKVTVWYTAPTALRMAMKSGTEMVKKQKFPKLRFMASVGEPLDSETVRWGMEAFGLPIHDNWWQTETGGIMIANYASMDIKPGSMGKPLPGVEVFIVERTSSGIKVITEPDVQGEIAIKKGWPSMFRGYLHQEERYQKCFVEDFYLTGDLARRDKDGYFWFVGRTDDIIKSSGHLIGPFEVESALMEDSSVAEAAVIGMPDPVAGEIVKAFVVLNPEIPQSEELKSEIHAQARKKLGPSIAPREIIFIKDLPKTRSGKIMRRLLKARELGLPEGDTSTLENPTI